MGVTRKTFLLLGGALMFVVLAAGCARRGGEKLAASGTIAATAAAVAAEVGGRVEEVLVQEGTGVKKGQVVARLDARAAELQLKQAEASLEAAMARLADARAGARGEQLRQAQEAVNQAQAMREQAQRNLNNMQQLFHEGAATRSQLDTAATQLQTAEAQYAAAVAQLDLLRAGATPHVLRGLSAAVDQARAIVSQARLQVEKTVVTAPVDGTVVGRHVEAGEMVLPGAPLFTLADLGQMWIRVYIPERDLGGVFLGQEARVTADPFPGRVFKGRVVSIADRAEFTPKNVQTREQRVNTVFAVKVSVEGGENLLKPGMPADVEFLPSPPAR